MTSTTKIAAALLATATLVATAGLAQAKSASDIRQEAIEKREAAQKESIQDGRKDGSITIWERARLTREQKRIERLEKDALTDGHISKGEYREIKSAQDRARAHIKEEKSNEAVRGWWWRNFVRHQD